MQINIEPTVIASKGLATPTEFKINTSATAFKILSSSLYSDKILAVIRELTCNAVDAHNAQGCPERPIELKLPSRLDRQFYVKDFGPGLTEEQIVDFYTTYFGSSKSDNNDAIGGFGLGCKAPFAYTDRFSVVTSRDGSMRTYAMFISDAGTPTFTLINTRPSPDNWPHGTLVQIPVTEKDIHTFSGTAVSLLKWFTVPPISPSGSTVAAPVKFAWRDGPYAVVDSTSHRIDRPYVIMGGVPYPIDTNKFTTSRMFHGTCLFLPIGTVDITVSRESLEYTQRTIDTLGTHIDRWNATAAVQCETEIVKANPRLLSEWSATQDLPYFKSMGSHIIDFLPYFKDNALATRAKTFLLDRGYSLPRALYNTKLATHECFKRKYNGTIETEALEPYSSFYFSISQYDGIVVINDCHGATRRVRHYVKETGSQCILISLADQTKTTADLEAYAQSIITSGAPFLVMNASALPKPPPPVRVPKDPNKLATAIGDRDIWIFEPSKPVTSPKQAKLSELNSTPSYFIPSSGILGNSYRDSVVQKLDIDLTNVRKVFPALGLPAPTIFTTALNATSPKQLASLGHSPLYDAIPQICQANVDKIAPSKRLFWPHYKYDSSCYFGSLGDFLAAHFIHNTQFFQLIRQSVPSIDAVAKPYDKYLPATDESQAFIKLWMTFNGDKNLPTNFAEMENVAYLNASDQFNQIGNLRFPASDVISNLAFTQPSKAAQMLTIALT